MAPSGDKETAYLLSVEHTRLKYDISLRWLRLARWHQWELCQFGFGQSQAHLVVGDCLVQLHAKEQALRIEAERLGIPTADYRFMYS